MEVVVTESSSPEPTPQAVVDTPDVEVAEVPPEPVPEVKPEPRRQRVEVRAPCESDVLPSEPVALRGP